MPDDFYLKQSESRMYKVRESLPFSSPISHPLNPPIAGMELDSEADLIEQTPHGLGNRYMRKAKARGKKGRECLMWEDEIVITPILC